MTLARLLLGRRLANRESAERKIGALEAVPAMGLDGLGSSSYGPEAALTTLLPLGVAGLSLIGPIIGVIIALLAILYLSYRQTIRAYPNNGGAYIVARENLGRWAALLAAAALMVDYVLNVAVGISAGVAALTSAVPDLHSHTLPLCLGVLALITLSNLRGTLDAGRLFALPTYLFVASFLALLTIGLYRINAGDVAPVVAPPALPNTGTEIGQAAGLWLILHAFASGCTAMTGVEAVSNGMSAFRDPPVRHARRTLTAIVAILAILLLGVANLARAYGIGAMDQSQPGYQSVLSQLAAAVVGRGVFYFVAIGSLLAVLILSANTSFVDFPRLCRTVAQDGYLPRAFALAGRRLVFSVGILYLAATAALLLVAFGGITDHLIPLFAIGAFLTFTLSQSGMVVHWLGARREAGTAKDRARHGLHFLINLVGATTTGIALLVIILAKFTEGAWITLIALPCVILLLTAIRRYYDEMARRTRDPGALAIPRPKAPVILVATEEWSRLTDKALSFALTLSPDVIAVHLSSLEGPETEAPGRDLKERWSQDVERPAREAGLAPPRLVILSAQYRRMHEPVLKLIERLSSEQPDRIFALLIPELVKRRWYQYLLHTHRSQRLRTNLLKSGRPDLLIINVPWDLEAGS